MLLNFATGLPVMLICLVLQATFVSIGLRHYARFRRFQRVRSRLSDIIVLATIMLLMLLANFIQIGIWAALFVALGEFDDFATALYSSAVNFVTLGYGDIIMSDRWRLLGPLEAANGVLMFGVSTAAITAAIFNALKDNEHDPNGRP